MAPTRRSTRQSLLNTSYDLEAQIQEYQRYEQELKDRILARNMQREYDERRNSPAPIVRPLPENGPIVPEEITLQTNQASVNNAPDEMPPPSPILAGAPRIQRRLNEGNSGNRVLIVAGEPSPGPMIIRVPRPRSQSLHIRGPVLVNPRIPNDLSAAQVIFESDSSDTSDTSDDEIVVLPTPSNRPTNSHNNDSSSSSSSGDSSASVRTTRSNIQSVSSSPITGRDISISSASTSVISTASGPPRQPLIDNDVQMYQREYEPIDNQPSTSQITPIAQVRKGNPDPTWGDCTMCFEVPIRPQGCVRCYQLIGCKTCVDGWHKSAQHPSCPLCRRRWGQRPDVATMPTIDSRRRSQAVRRSRARRNQVSSDDSHA